MSDRLAIPQDVAWTAEEGEGGSLRIFLAPLPRGPVLVLTDTAATVWQLATTGGESSLVGRVAAATGQPTRLVRSDVEGFVDDLIGRGLLTRT